MSSPANEARHILQAPPESNLHVRRFASDRTLQEPRDHDPGSKEMEPASRAKGKGSSWSCVCRATVGLYLLVSSEPYQIT